MLLRAMPSTTLAQFFSPVIQGWSDDGRRKTTRRDLAFAFGRGNLRRVRGGQPAGASRRPCRLWRSTTSDVGHDRQHAGPRGLWRRYPLPPGFGSIPRRLTQGSVGFESSSAVAGVSTGTIFVVPNEKPPWPGRNSRWSAPRVGLPN